MKLMLLAGLYLFFVRVLWSVYNELRDPKALGELQQSPPAVAARPAGRSQQRNQVSPTATSPSRSQQSGNRRAKNPSTVKASSAVKAPKAPALRGSSKPPSKAKPKSSTTRQRDELIPQPSNRKPELIPQLHPEPQTAPVSSPNTKPAKRRETPVVASAASFFETPDPNKPAGQMEILAPYDRAGDKFMIDRTITIGRSANNDLIFDDEYVSQHHARLLCNQDGYFIEDLGSRNGTLLNDQKLSATTMLEAGDRISLGSTVLEFS